MFRLEWHIRWIYDEFGHDWLWIYYKSHLRSKCECYMRLMVRFHFALSSKHFPWKSIIFDKRERWKLKGECFTEECRYILKLVILISYWRNRQICGIYGKNDAIKEWIFNPNKQTMDSIKEVSLVAPQYLHLIDLFLRIKNVLHWFGEQSWTWL